jgi:hypothetical protein
MILMSLSSQTPLSHLSAISLMFPPSPTILVPSQQSTLYSQASQPSPTPHGTHIFRIYKFAVNIRFTCALSTMHFPFKFHVYWRSKVLSYACMFVVFLFILLFIPLYRPTVYLCQFVVKYFFVARHLIFFSPFCCAFCSFCGLCSFILRFSLLISYYSRSVHTRLTDCACALLIHTFLKKVVL